MTPPPAGLDLRDPADLDAFWQWVGQVNASPICTDPAHDADVVALTPAGAAALQDGTS